MFVLSPLGAANLSALAPPSALLPPDPYYQDRAWLGTTAKIAHAMKVTPESLRKSFQRLEISPIYLRPLISQLNYLVSYHIFPEEALWSLRTQPARRVAKAMLALAWYSENGRPWKIACKGPLRNIWDGLDLKEALRKWEPPDAHVNDLLRTCFDITDFSMKNFFAHPDLARIPGNIRARIKRLVDAEPKFQNPWSLRTLTLVYCNPYFYPEVTALLEEHRSLPGIEKVLGNLNLPISSNQDYAFRSGSLNQLAMLRPGFLDKKYDIVDLDTTVLSGNTEYTELDVLAVHEGRMILGKTHSINISLYRDRYKGPELLSTDAQRNAFESYIRAEFRLGYTALDWLKSSQSVSHLLKRAWIAGNIEKKVHRYMDMNRDQANSLLNRCGVRDLGEIVFCLNVRNDPEFEGLIRDALKSLSDQYRHLVTMRAEFLYATPLMSPYEDIVDGLPPVTTQRNLTPEVHSDLRHAFEALNYRWHMEIFQSHVKAMTGEAVGMEHLHGMLLAAEGNHTVLTDLLKEHGQRQVSDWLENFPWEFKARIKAREIAMPEPVPAEKRAALNPSPEPSALSASSAGPASVSRLAITLSSIAHHPSFAGWPHLFAFFDGLREDTELLSLEKRIWKIIGANIWIVPKKDWPADPDLAVIRMADGQVLLNESFLKTLDTAEELEVVLGEEAVLRMVYNGVRYSPSMLQSFQKYFAGARETLRQKALAFKAKLAQDKSREQSRKAFLERLEALKTQYRETSQPLESGVAGVEDWIRKATESLRKETFEPEETRKVLRTLAAEIKRFQAATREFKAPAPSSPDLAANQATSTSP